jgi:hypothetical protein
MKYGSRKFLFALGTLLAATGLLYFTLLSGSEWVSIMQADLIFYGAANVGAKFANREPQP